MDYPYILAAIINTPAVYLLSMFALSLIHFKVTGVPLL